MSTLQEDLKKALELIKVDWNMQSNKNDSKTNFIYRVKSLDECLNEIEKHNVDKLYTLHRWYNYKTSIKCEYIFCNYGAIHESNRFNHDVDIYIKGIPFDVKLTVYPSKLSDRPFDLSTQEGKNELIRWLYANQSQESRKQILNRIYVICDAPTSEEKLSMKSNFSLMSERIASYMRHIEKHGFNEITITENNTDYNLKSDIIILD